MSFLWRACSKTLCNLFKLWFHLHMQSLQLYLQIKHVFMYTRGITIDTYLFYSLDYIYIFRSAFIQFAKVFFWDGRNCSLQNTYLPQKMSLLAFLQLQIYTKLWNIVMSKHSLHYKCISWWLQCKALQSWAIPSASLPVAALSNQPHISTAFGVDFWISECWWCRWICNGFYYKLKATPFSPTLC